MLLLPSPNPELNERLCVSEEEAELVCSELVGDVVAVREKAGLCNEDSLWVTEGEAIRL